jgi:hypothetical protein
MNLSAAIAEYVDADRALAEQCLSDLTAGIADETPAWQKANERLREAQTKIPARNRPEAEVACKSQNLQLWKQVWAISEESRS